MKLRPAIDADIPAITAIYNEAIQTTTATFDTEEKSVDDRRTWLASHGPRHPVIVADGGSVVGWACLTQWSDRKAYDGTCENSVYVARSARGNGTGKALLAELIQIARKHAMHTIIARIAAGNPASERLHESAGFARVGTMREVGRKFGKLIDVHIYQLML